MDHQLPDEAPDLTGLKPSYATPVSRTLRWVVVAVFALNLGSGILRLMNEVDAWNVGSLAVMLVFWGAWVVLTIFTPAATRLSADGPAVRRVGRWRRYEWRQVRKVSVQTRWTDVSLLVLEGGREERLMGVPLEDAQRLADALTARGGEVSST